MTTKTHKAGVTSWRLEVMNTLNMKYEIKKGQIIYKGDLNESLVGFLVTKKNELNISL